MRLKSVVIDSIKGIHHLEFQAGAVTVVSGKNGTGKTSIIDAVRSPFEGGHDPSVIRTGAKKGTITLTIQNGAGDITIKRTITAKSSTTEVMTPDGAVVKGPAAYIETLAAGFAFDPLAFIEASPKDRAKFLLAAMPITFTCDEVAAAVEGLGLVIEKDYDLDGLELIRKGQYEARTAANVAHRDIQGILNALNRAHNSEDKTNWAAMAKAKEMELAELRAGVARDMEGIKQEARDAAEKHMTRLMEKEGEIRSRLQKELDTVSKERTEVVRAISTSENEALGELAERSQPGLDTAIATVSEAKEKAAQQQRSEGAKEEHEKAYAQSRKLSVNADKITAALERIEVLKKAKMASLPVEGVQARDGDVYIGEIPFGQLNTQQQYFYSFQFGALKLGKLPLMICDRAEALDDENFKEFCAAAAEAGIQVIAARVQDKPLEVSAA